jgi:hypothetical protein
MEKSERNATTAQANPWPRHVSFITTASALPSVAIAFYALAKQNPRKLLLYSGLWAALTTVARRDICARCPYYGEYCSTLFGKTTALMFPPSEKPMTTQGFYWDLTLLPLLFAYPLPDIQRRSKLLLAAYIKAWLLFLAAMYNLACKKCPLEACPVPR